MSVFDRLQLHYWRHIWDQHAEKETGWEDTLSVKNSGVPVCKIKDFRVPLWLVTERERGLSWLKKTKKVCLKLNVESIVVVITEDLVKEKYSK